MNSFVRTSKPSSLTVQNQLAHRLPLTPKQLAFIDHYMTDHNATQAAIRAGYAPKSANSAGPNLARNPRIAREIEARALAAAEKSAMSAGEVMRRLTLMAAFDLTEIMVDVPGMPGKFTLRPLAEWSEAARASVVSWKLGPGGVVTEVKLADKKAALVDIGRAHGMFKDVVEMADSGDDALRDRLRASADDLEAELRGRKASLRAVS